MTTSELSKFRSAMDGCEVALLADVDMQTCLLFDSAADLGQEWLDQLCQQASRYLNDIAPVPETRCLLVRPGGTRVFVRNMASDSEALCLAFAPHANLEGVEDAARDMLAQVLSEQL